ncbi:hypothetical protein BWQ96_08726 [Gracilariopsis chorda]|uniref:EamA domain-containing protein n=1 Tax=Gracilariopsis chorda TaxID=448386 RepID=A0A2V3IHM4_9FLOR|nr:hypothetical protein BWQ96_08726 [Gracilariopsis chorda]|eukprot:PXF41523.1 hypothetical protein BWQ96_08726 [Gracilariopsis chorda]
MTITRTTLEDGPLATSPQQPMIIVTPHAPSRRNHIIGVIIVIMVALIWTFSAELIQHIFQDGKSFDKPYFLTYFSVSLFSLLLGGFARRSWRTTPTWDALEQTEQPMQQISGSAVMEGEYDPDFDRPSKIHLRPRDVFRLGAQLAPIFFMSSWTYNVGLDLTSVASSSIIASLTTLFTLLIGVFMGSVKFTMSKLMATVLCTIGVALVSQQDNTNGEHARRSLFGDLLSIASSFIYGFYTVILNINTERSSFSVSMLLGFLGLTNLIALWPGLIVFSLFGWEKFELPPAKVIAMLTVNGLVGTVLSDFLWAKSVELAGPLLGTLSLSLSVPFSMVADYFIRDRGFSFIYVVGTVLVISGFLLMNYEIASERAEENAQHGTELEETG